MARRSLTCAVVVALLAWPGSASAQSVPETIHSDAEGPSTLCGVTGANASTLIEAVRANPQLTEKHSGSPRFEFYVSGDEMIQWVFTRPSEPAHPAVTCRQLKKDVGGSIWMNRAMRCDADRASCDKLFLEFQALDQQAQDALRR